MKETTMNEQRAVEAVEVTQADHKLALDHLGWDSEDDLHQWAIDNDLERFEQLVQAFARHRIASVAAARPLLFEEAAGVVERWPSDVLVVGDQSEQFQRGARWACLHAATAIRTGGSKTDG